MCISGGRLFDFTHSAGAEGGKPIRRVPRHQHLFFEGDDRACFFVIETGWVKLYRTLIDGHRQVVGFCNGGSIVGLESDDSHVNSCEAITDVEVRAIPVARLSEMCARDPSLAALLLRQMGRQLGAAQAQLATVGAQSADQKLATFLLAFADHGATDDHEFDLPMRRSDIAEFLGLRLETVSRKFTEFQRKGWLKMPSLYRCRIANRDCLENLAEGDAEPAAFALAAH